MYSTKAADEALSRAAYTTVYEQCMQALELSSSAEELHMLDKVVNKTLSDLDMKSAREKNSEESVSLSLPKSLSRNSHGGHGSKGGGTADHDTASDILAFTDLHIQITTKMLEYGLNPFGQNDGSASASAGEISPPAPALGKAVANGRSGRMLTVLTDADKAKFKLSYTDLKPVRTIRRKSVADKITDRIADKFTFVDKKVVGARGLVTGEPQDGDAADKEACIIM